MVWNAQGQRARLVEDDGVDAMVYLERCTATDERVSRLRPASRPDDDGRWGGEVDRGTGCATTTMLIYAVDASVMRGSGCNVSHVRNVPAATT